LTTGTVLDKEPLPVTGAVTSSSQNRAAGRAALAHLALGVVPAVTDVMYLADGLIVASELFRSEMAEKGSSFHGAPARWSTKEAQAQPRWRRGRSRRWRHL
jgi:hypothetical protein